MHIQDIIFAAGSIVFFIALIPSITGPDKPAMSSSVITGSVLTIFAGTYVTMNYWYAAATTLITAVCWFILYTQKRTQIRHG